jgi:hypothetical protein
MVKNRQRLATMRSLDTLALPGYKRTEKLAFSMVYRNGQATMRISVLPTCQIQIVAVGISIICDLPKLAKAIDVILLWSHPCPN